MLATVALLIRLQCAAWSGTDYDCQAQWAEDALLDLAQDKCLERHHGETTNYYECVESYIDAVLVTNDD
jgi:hypothetical protein